MRTLCLLATTALLLACGSPPEARRRNVVLVVVDTLSTRHLGLYGYARPTSPNLESLAAESVVFEQARAQAPCTFPSVSSLLTSRHPQASFVGQTEGSMGIPEEIPSIAEMLAAAGYATGCRQR
jgi:arylsulfatase A-like enzyme